MDAQPLLAADRTGQIHLPAETQFADHGIVSRTVLQAETFRVVLFGFDAGQELTEHTTARPALVQILSGRCEWQLDGETRELKAGDVLYMPPGVPHAVRAIERFSMLLTLGNRPA
ncbi:MAG: cupin domain-containing protein [Verrucomicrobia bacterium]|nr:MAG: cupin domain-containing protein [Verrucomicrobiota bacterium]